MGKRAREADAAPPLSALARRKAAKAAAEPAVKSAPRPASPVKAPAPPKAVEKPLVDAKVEVDADADTSSSSSDEDDDEGVRDAERLALKGPAGQRPRQQRYFAVKEPRGRTDEAMDEDERPSSPVSDAEPEPQTAPSPSAAAPSTSARLAVDPACRSTFVPTLGSNMLHEGATRILGLQAEETVVVFGVARLRVVRGRISIGGAVLTPSSPALDLYAPSSHPLPVIAALASSAPEPSTSAAAAVLPDASVVVRLESLQSGLVGIERPLQASGVLARSERMWPRAEGRTFELIFEAQPSLSAQRVPPAWQAALDHVCGLTIEDAQSRARPVIVVEGAKRTGKSTLVKLLVNRLLLAHDVVSLLDTDLGQPELTPPGLVSLHQLDAPLIGPSFTHHRPPVRAHFLGATSPASDPEHYVAALTDLVETADLSAPLVINTQGWVKGLGEDLLIQLKRLVRPTHVLRLGDIDVTDPQAESDLPGQIVSLPAFEPAIPARLSAAEQRTLNVLAYLHATDGGGGWDFATALTHRRPRVLDWTRDVAALHVLHHRIERAHILYALNASLVAIVALDEPASTADDGLPYDATASSPSPSSSHCVGLALIRGIDVERRQLHILTPIAIDVLRSLEHVALVKGDVELPTIGLLDWTQATVGVSVDGQAAEYLTAAPLRSDVVGATKRKTRRNLQRR